MSGLVTAERIRSREARLVVIGQGYVGLPLAVAFAEAGFRVQGFDSDADRVSSLGLGRSYIADVDSTRLRAVVGSGHYGATTRVEVLAEADVVVICVPTPLRKSKDPDISYIVAAVE